MFPFHPQTLLFYLIATRCAVAVISQPVSVAPSEIFDGNDGAWSSFAIQVGTPPQQLRVYASTESDSTWVVVPEGCVEQDGTDCADNRGTEFKINGSSTWDNLGLYELVYEGMATLGYVGNAYVGMDNLQLGWPGSGAPSLENQIIEGFAAQYPFLGLLGLTPRAVNLTSLNERHTSLMDSLKNAALIPSLSYGYTAGASYREPQVFGSLTLGGYDTARFIQSNLTVTFGADISRELLVGVQSISSNSSSVPLMSDGIMALIDSAVSTIWLPESACDLFEKAFNLTWDSNTELYLLNDTTHQALLALNPTITFQIGSELDSDDTIDIILPYASFDLQVSEPFVDTATYYFPLQRAANQTQYTLGRTFLQEAYIIVDYERGNFSVSQALFPSTAVGKELVAIYPVDYTIPSHRSNIGAIVGGVVGGVVGTAALVIVVLLLRRRAQRKRKTNDSKENDEKVDSEKSNDEVILKAELEVPETKATHEDQLKPSVPSELPDEPIVYYEMEGSNIQAVEKPGDEAGAEIDERYSFEGRPTEFDIQRPDGEPSTISQNSTLHETGRPRHFSFDVGSGTILDIKKPEENSFASNMSGSTILATERSGEWYSGDMSHRERVDESIREEPLNNLIEHTTPVDSLPRYHELTREGNTNLTGNHSSSFPEKGPLT